MSGHREDPIDVPGWSRRRMLLSATGVLGAGALLERLAAPSEAGAAPAPPSVASVPIVARLAEISADECIAFAEGLRTPGDGAGGLFVWRASPDAARRGAPIETDDGFVRVAGRAGSVGSWTRLDHDGAGVRPEWFGSLRFEEDHAPILQRAIDYATATDGGGVELGSRTYRCLSPLRLDPTRCMLAASGATLDFSERPEIRPKRGETVSIDDLAAAASAAWFAEDGVLKRRGIATAPLVLTRRFAAGERHRADVDLARLAGDPNAPVLRIRFTGAATGTLVREIALSAACRIAFEFDAPDEDCVLSLSGNSDVDLRLFDVVAVGRRECLLIRCDAASPRYGHRWIEGLRLRGPGISAGRRTQLEAIRFETETAGSASRLALREVAVEGFGTAVVLSHRCYLTQFASCRLVSQVGVEFLAGSEDAGENIAFFGCTIGGGKVGIRNAGAELHLFGTSINFCDQFYVGTGSLHAFGCHFETERTRRADQFLFDVGKGSVRIEAGTMLVGGRDFDAGNEAEYVVMVRARLASFRMTGTACYNLRSRSGVFAGGEGTVGLAQLAGDARRFVAPIPKRDLAANLFGPASRLDGTGGELRIRLAGAPGRDAAARVERLAPAAASEPGLLSITKAGEGGAPLWCWLLARCLPAMHAAYALDVMLASAGDAAPADPERALRLDVLFCEVEPGAQGVPDAFVTAKRPIAVPLRALENWHAIVGSTHDTREDEWSDGSAPAFATHLALRLDLADFAAGDRLLLRTPFAGAA